MSSLPLSKKYIALQALTLINKAKMRSNWHMLLTAMIATAESTQLKSSAITSTSSS